MTIITLDVGGQIMRTNLSTLTKYPDSMLSAMFKSEERGLAPMPKTENGHFFLDFEPEDFRFILNFLRIGRVSVEASKIPQSVLDMADYFGIKEVMMVNSKPEEAKEDDTIAKVKENQVKIDGCVKTLEFAEQWADILGRERDCRCPSSINSIKPRLAICCPEDSREVSRQLYYMKMDLHSMRKDNNLVFELDRILKPDIFSALFNNSD